jgi:hypothetical protein
VPKFAVFPRGRRVHRPKGLEFPLIVKSLIHEASLGISQASIVDNDEKLRERVAFIHQRHGSDSIVEQYIDGREFYVGIIGNTRLEVLPTWELLFENLPPGAVPIATAHVKHNPDYQERRGIFQRHAEDLPESLRTRIVRPRNIARILDLDGYNRVDYRYSPDGKLYFLGKPNPDIAKSEGSRRRPRRRGCPFGSSFSESSISGCRERPDGELIGPCVGPTCASPRSFSVCFPVSFSGPATSGRRKRPLRRSSSRPPNRRRRSSRTSSSARCRSRTYSARR